jgi:hypothetical protein
LKKILQEKVFDVSNEGEQTYENMTMPSFRGEEQKTSQK